MNATNGEVAPPIQRREVAKKGPDIKPPEGPKALGEKDQRMLDRVHKGGDSTNLLRDIAAGREKPVDSKPPEIPMQPPRTEAQAKSSNDLIELSWKMKNFIGPDKKTEEKPRVEQVNAEPKNAEGPKPLGEKGDTLVTETKVTPNEKLVVEAAESKPKPAEQVSEVQKTEQASRQEQPQKPAEIQETSSTQTGEKGTEKIDQRSEREIGDSLTQEAITKRNQLLEGRGMLPMHEEEFKQYFESGKWKQQNLGNCYAVAGIDALRRSPHFETIVRSSMKKLPDGSWEVKVPLMDENGQVVKISPEDILPQKNPQFLKRREGKLLPDFRRTLKPPKGPEGLKVLEAVYLKEEFGKVDRLKGEQGYASSSLKVLGGDNFIKNEFSSFEYGNDDKKDYSKSENFLTNFDPNIDIATVFNSMTLDEYDSAPSKTLFKAGIVRAKGTAKFIVRKHAYSIQSVDSEKRMVSLANPWDTSKPFDLTFDQLKGSFDRVDAVRINNANLLKNMNAISDKAA